jgi:hypothetical protein
MANHHSAVAFATDLAQRRHHSAVLEDVTTVPSLQESTCGGDILRTQADLDEVAVAENKTNKQTVGLLLADRWLFIICLCC